MGARRCTIAVTAVILLATAPVRTDAGVRTVKDLEGVAPGTRVRVEGTVSMRGSTPFTILVVETEVGAVVTIESTSSEIQRDLRGLAGMRVAVEGTVLARIDPNIPRLDPDRYDLLPLPDGTRPIIGVLALEGDAEIVTTREGKRYWILGELAPALHEYVGARVWIVGNKSRRSGEAPPRASTPFTPTGYGVIDDTP